GKRTSSKIGNMRSRSSGQCARQKRPVSKSEKSAPLLPNPKAQRKLNANATMQISVFTLLDSMHPRVNEVRNRVGYMIRNIKQFVRRYVDESFFSNGYKVSPSGAACKRHLRVLHFFVGYDDKIRFKLRQCF